MDPITVAVLGDPEVPAFRGLARIASVASVTIAKTASDLGDALPAAQVLFNWTGTKADVRLVMEKAPQLKWIHARFAGLDGILFPELIQSSIPLTNGSGTFSQSLGEFVMAGALYWAKDLPRMLRAKTAGRWETFDVLELSTQTMGIVGHGDIGRAIARRARAFGMRVLAMRRNPAPRPGDEDVDRVYAASELHQMLRECDYAVVAAPLTPETKHLMSTPEFQQMKKESIIMNVGRGPVIDESAMVEALRTGLIRGAFLDVFEVEPLPADSPLWTMDNVLISAHTADHTATWMNDAVGFFIDQFESWRKGEPLRNVVNKHAGY